MKRPVPTLGIIVGLTVLSFAAPAGAQPEERRPSPGFRGEAIIYRDVGFAGPAVNVSRAEPDLRLAWPVRSIRVRQGRWELCTLSNYRGRCTTVDRDSADLRRQVNFLDRVGSMRPLPGGWQPEPPAQERSLRGMAAEFFPAPVRNGRRVPACERGQATANCAAQTADRFCRERGWNGSAREALETVNRQVFLADTLCTRTGR
ncbi:MAG: hypothetical protein KF780_05880 [Sphingomonas sp.]|nr:hypothetical protein [Sphingomonas sp.]